MWYRDILDLAGEEDFVAKKVNKSTNPRKFTKQ